MCSFISRSHLVQTRSQAFWSWLSLKMKCSIKGTFCNWRQIKFSLKFCAFSFVDPYWIVRLISIQEQQPIIFISLNWWKHIAVWVIDFIRVPNKENRSDLSTTQCHKLVHLSLNAPKSKICVLLKIMALVKVLPDWIQSF